MDYKHLDIHIDDVTFEEIIAKQGDIGSRFLIMRIIENGSIMNLTGRTVRAYAIKPDNKIIYNDCEITDAVNGIATLEFTSQMLAVDGKVEIELVIMEGKKKLSTVSFFVTVKKSINSDAAIESTDEFTALVVALATVQEFDARIKALETDMPIAKTDIENLKNNKFDKTGGNVSGNVHASGYVTAENGMNVKRGYFCVYPYSAGYDEVDNSYLQSFYDAKQKRWQIYRRMQDTASVDTDTNISIRLGSNIVMTDSGGTFKGNITVPQINLSNGGKILVSSSGNMHLQGFSGGLFVNDKKVITADKFNNTYVYVYGKTAQSIGNDTAVNFNTKVEDTNGEYNTSTNKFTAKKDGLYLFTVNLIISGTATTSASAVLLEVTSGSTTTKHSMGGNNRGNSFIFVNSSITLKLKTGDTAVIKASMYFSETGTLNTGQNCNNLTITSIPS